MCNLLSTPVPGRKSCQNMAGILHKEMRDNPPLVLPPPHVQPNMQTPKASSGSSAKTSMSVSQPSCKPCTAPKSQNSSASQSNQHKPSLQPAAQPTQRSISNSNESNTHSNIEDTVYLITDSDGHNIHPHRMYNGRVKAQIKTLLNKTIPDAALHIKSVSVKNSVITYIVGSNDLTKCKV